jgi:GNAT superfamily N-acetyltransferase
MRLIYTEQLSKNQHQQIDFLWNKEYPKNLMNRFSMLLADATDYRHFIIENQQNIIVGWAVLFAAENETRFSILVDEIYKGKGLGGQLIDELKKACPSFYGWVIDHSNDLKNDGSIYRSPLPFYVKLQFQVLNNQRLETPIISAVKVKWQAEDLLVECPKK